MNFKITPLFTEKDIQKEIDKHMVALNRLMLKEINRVGLQFVTDARNNADFDDQTGNLRSSIGYIVLYDGKVVEENFEAGSRGTDKAEGVKAGREYAEYLGSLNPTGYVLITVAGMDYAGYVEAKGFDVITGSTNSAAKDMRVVFQNVKRALQK